MNFVNFSTNRVVRPFGAARAPRCVSVRPPVCKDYVEELYKIRKIDNPIGCPPATLYGCRPVKNAVIPPSTNIPIKNVIPMYNVNGQIFNPNVPNYGSAGFGGMWWVNGHLVNS
jgi:hypothetical protein